ncbi:MAG: hypothetical protein R3B72_49630 [Polyangiaceae bacterium]
MQDRHRREICPPGRDFHKGCSAHLRTLAACARRAQVCRDRDYPYDATGTFGRLWQAAEPLEPEFAKALAQASATSLIPPELGDGELNFPSFTNPTGYRWLGSSPFLPDDAGIVLYEEPLYLYAVVVRFDQEGELVTFLPVAGMESASQVHTGLRATFSDNAVAVTTIVESMGTRRERSRAVALRIDGATLGAPTPWLDVLK